MTRPKQIGLVGRDIFFLWKAVYERKPLLYLWGKYFRILLLLSSNANQSKIVIAKTYGQLGTVNKQISGRQARLTSSNVTESVHW